VLASAEELAARGIEVFECDRGGDVTFMAGQLVGYRYLIYEGSAVTSTISNQELTQNHPSWCKTLVLSTMFAAREVLIRTAAISASQPTVSWAHGRLD